MTISFTITKFPTFQHSNIPTFQHSNIPTFQHSNIPTFHHSTIPPFHHSNIPPFQHSNIPPFQHSNIPPFQRLRQVFQFFGASIKPQSPSNNQPLPQTISHHNPKRSVVDGFIKHIDSYNRIRNYKKQCA